jgi:hypothetical protein
MRDEVRVGPNPRVAREPGALSLINEQPNGAHLSPISPRQRGYKLKLLNWDTKLLASSYINAL